MSALLYIPPGATAQTPAPGILATGHRCIISREIQDGFAIEFARRGHVVLAALHRHRHPVLPLSVIAAVIATFTWRRTGSSRRAP
jgi:hypothetical protein